jgi:hypothetical protein
LNAFRRSARGKILAAVVFAGLVPFPAAVLLARERGQPD